MGKQYFGPEFRTALRLLKANAPLGYPLSVRSVPAAVLRKQYECECDGDYASYVIDGKLSSFLIRISRNQSDYQARETLLHEYAHCLDVADGCNAPRDHHRKSWGECFSVAYRAVFG